MHRLIIYLALSCLLALHAAAQTVYVCSSSTRGKYHIDKSCRGLKQCGGTIKATSVAQMAAQGRGPCKICSEGVVQRSGGQSSAPSGSAKGKPTAVAASKPFSTKGLELPTTAKGRKAQVIAHQGYTTCYNSAWLVPNWVAYALTKQELGGTEPRPNKPFEPDPMVKGKSAEHADYTNSGYSRGHMAPAADMKWSRQAMLESFYLSNVCPQLPALNGGVWERLEARCRALASSGTVYICCGPIMPASPKRIGRNGVAVPTSFYKVMCMQRGGKWQAIGFIMPNAAIKGSMFDYAKTVDEVEKATGHDFFPALPDEVEKTIESAWSMKDWQ